MEKETFTVNVEHGDLSYYYGEWHISGHLEDFLDNINGKNLKITVEVLED